MSEPIDNLTEKERALLRLVDRDRSLDELAYLLGIATGTVKVHIRNINRKLGTNTRFEAAKLAFGDSEHTSQGGIPPREVAIPDPSQGNYPVAEEMPASKRPISAINEDRAVFLIAETVTEKAARGDRTFKRNVVFTTLGITLLIVLLIVLAPLLGDSIQRLANLIDPPTS